jgi:predicted O-methyltransferase YrrM
MQIANRFRKLTGLPAAIPIHWDKRGGRVAAILKNSFRAQPGRFESKIEARARETQKGGNYALWETYNQPDATRSPDTVRSGKDAGRFYSWLVTELRPKVVVEFGTAFGVSGMYWLAGLVQNGEGELLTFEPNATWRQIALGNLTAVGDRFTSYLGTFEENVEGALDGRTIDIAFIDAIHTSEWVIPQFEIVCRHLKPGGVVVLDDIDFSDDMALCWRTVVSGLRVAAALRFGNRVGILEMT